uniref:hypothetical protein n=1 Tax=Ligilactobacillus sp. TaxID=2767921 RepID=UPI002FDF1C37
DMKTLFFKYSAENRLPSQAPRRDYGQNGNLGDLPVNGNHWLRAKHTFNVAYKNKAPDEIRS